MVAPALERERTGENLGNVLCALVGLGDLDEALELLETMETKGVRPNSFAFNAAINAQVGGPG